MNWRAKLWFAGAWASVLFSFTGRAQNPSNVWRLLEQLPPAKAPDEIWVQPQVYRAFSLNHGALRSLLGTAQKENGPRGTAGPTISLPMPDGSVAKFRFVEASVMAPELAAQFPEIKSYLGQG